MGTKMTADSLMISSLNQVPQTGNLSELQGYYRSRLYVIPNTTNPILAAASPIFSLLERLYVSQSLPSINVVRNNIEHELKAFQSKLVADNYATPAIALAVYLLSATIDELLGKNYLRLYGHHVEFKAFTPATVDDSNPGQRFFEIVNFLKDRPNQYLDLIELSYFCLVAGYEGEFHLKTDGRQNLENLIEALYQLILRSRVSKPLQLIHHSNIPKITVVNHKKKMIGAALAAGLLLATYFFGESFLDNKAKQVLFEHYQLARLDN